MTMLTDSPYVAKRIQAGVPIWDILVRGEDVGILTDLPMEDSPMATVRYFGEEMSFDDETIYSVLEQVGFYLASIDSHLEAEVIAFQAESSMDWADKDSTW